MVAQAAKTSPKYAAMVRAFDRAKEERLIAFRNADGTWAVKSYTLTVTGTGAADVRCNCSAGSKGLVCKHLVCVTFCRKHGVRPIRPVVAPVAYKATVAAKVAASIDPLACCFG
jgi:hypothetical protein